LGVPRNGGPPELDPAFTAFWGAYPRKVGRGAAAAAWRKVDPSAELAGRIVDAVRAQARSAQWTRENGRFIPNPATWLNQARWADELDLSTPRTVTNLDGPRRFAEGHNA
jgi:hypothetical protein